MRATYRITRTGRFDFRAECRWLVLPHLPGQPEEWNSVPLHDSSCIGWADVCYLIARDIENVPEVGLGATHEDVYTALRSVPRARRNLILIHWRTEEPLQMPHIPGESPPPTYSFKLEAK